MALNREETENQVKDLIIEIRILASEGQFTTSWELTKTILRLFDEPFDHIEALEKQLEAVHITPLNIQLEAENKELKEKLENSNKTLEIIRKMDEVGLTYITKEVEKAEAKLKDMDLFVESLKADLIISQAKLEAIESNKVAEFIAEVSIGYYGEIAFWVPDGLEAKFKNSREPYKVTISKETK